MTVFVLHTHDHVLDRTGKEVVTAVTTIDVHDIARTCKTYGVAGYYLLHPNPVMHDLVGQVVRHWDTGVGGVTNPYRKEAFSLLHLVYDMEEALADMTEAAGARPFMLATTARQTPGALSVEEVKKKVYKSMPLCIILGSGWGLTPRFLEERCDAVLGAVRPQAPYNHLSVRAAAAIVLDRFFGDGEEA